MGLLVNPSQLVQVGWWGLFIALSLASIYRSPHRRVSKFNSIQLWHQRSPISELGGLRGAVPILLATIPVMQGVPNAEQIFNIVFFIVVINAMIPGMTVSWLTKRLGLQINVPPTPGAVWKSMHFTAWIRM